MCLDTVVISMLVFDAWFFRPNFTRGPEIVHFTGYRTPLDDAYKVIVERLKRIAARLLCTNYPLIVLVGG